MSACANCQHAKTRVGLLGRWVFCARFHTAVTVRCADYRQKGLGK